MKKMLMLSVLFLSAFAILPAQKLTILSPNGGETLVNGTPMQITWSFSKLSGNETLLIALEGSADFGPIAYSKVAAGALDWLAGQKMDGSFAKPAGGYKIIIELVDNDTAFDLSDQPFALAAPVSVVALMTPNGGETLEMGKDFDIRWSCAGQEGFVTLNLLKDEQPLGAIVENLPAASLSYRWRIGLPLANGVNYRIGPNYRVQVVWSAQATAGIAQAAVPTGQAAALLQKNSDRSDNPFQLTGIPEVKRQKSSTEREE
ncbi:MAG: GPI anchored serine-threonine rich family protein [Acidobacteria bacterium]|jgi:hypothetical protein|nr:GPI anchored serine-threonine rich family protein [Acidobacteriota bacterium]